MANNEFDRIIEIEDAYGARNYLPLPVVLTRGDGCHVWDVNGQRYLDLMSAYSAVSHGHAHPRLVAALHEQAQRLSVVSRAFYTDKLAPFLETACRLTGMDMALPMNAGVEAVETAIKVSRKWAYEVKGVADGDARIVACRGNFHGRTIAAISMSSERQYRHHFGPLTPGFDLVEFGDAAALEAAITPDTAAFFVEPIQGEGGIIVPPEGYLSACAEICRKHNILLICDEIQTGLGRTGKLLACEHEGVRPDGLLLGKALGGGLYPVSMVLTRRDVLGLLNPGDHGSTFGGNPLAAAIGLEALDTLVEDDLVANSAAMGERLMQGLRDIRSPLVTDIRGRGLLIGIDIDPTVTTARAVCERLMARGVLSKETHDTVVRIAPPLIIDASMVDWAIEQFRDTLSEFENTKPGG